MTRTWILASLGLVAACGGTGLCEGVGGVIDECFEDWSRAECEDWDAQGVNGSTWSWQGSGSCEDLGYTDECNGAWVLPGDC